MSCSYGFCQDPPNCTAVGACLGPNPNPDTVTIKCGLNPAEVSACLDVIAYQIGRQHNRWVKGAILWIQRAMDHSAARATDWADGWPEGAEKPGGLAMAKVVKERREDA